MRTAMIEITDRCNLNCAHCMNRTDFKNIETPIYDILNAIEKIVDHGIQKIYISGGEPLLHIHPPMTHTRRC